MISFELENEIFKAIREEMRMWSDEQWSDGEAIIGEMLLEEYGIDDDDARYYQQALRNE